MSGVDQKLYFIALVPPEPIFTEVEELRTYFSHHFESSAALKSPPHITLHMPFWLKAGKESLLIEQLEKITIDEDLNVVIDGFGSFPPKVIFLNVEPNQELLLLKRRIERALKIDLNIFNSEYKGKSFRPHLTLAFRDLKREQYRLAWKQFSTEKKQLNWYARCFFLLRHNGLSWDIYKEFNL